MAKVDMDLKGMMHGQIHDRHDMFKSMAGKLADPKVPIPDGALKTWH